MYFLGDAGTRPGGPRHLDTCSLSLDVRPDHVHLAQLATLRFWLQLLLVYTFRLSHRQFTSHAKAGHSALRFPRFAHSPHPWDRHSFWGERAFKNSSLVERQGTAYTVQCSGKWLLTAVRLTRYRLLVMAEGWTCHSCIPCMSDA